MSFVALKHMRKSDKTALRTKENNNDEIRNQTWQRKGDERENDDGIEGSILAEQVSETKSIQHSAKAPPTRRYEVQFQDDGRQHSDTNDLVQAEYYARSLGNWNLAAQVYDRVTQRIIFRAQAYAEKGNSSARSGLLAAGDCTCPGASVAG